MTTTHQRLYRGLGLAFIGLIAFGLLCSLRVSGAVKLAWTNVPVTQIADVPVLANDVLLIVLTNTTGMNYTNTGTCIATSDSDDWSVLTNSVDTSCFAILNGSSVEFNLQSLQTTNVTLAWDRSPDDSGVVGYNFYWWTNGVTNFMDMGDSTDVTITELGQDIAYGFAVTAYAAGEGQMSDTLTYNVPGHIFTIIKR